MTTLPKFKLSHASNNHPYGNAKFIALAVIHFLFTSVLSIHFICPFNSKTGNDRQLGAQIFILL